MLTRRNATILTLALLLGAGVLHGLCSERWTPAEALMQAAQRFERVPLDCGDWHGRTEKVDAEPFEQAGARAWWVRRYTRQRTGDTVLVILMCGRGGRMAVHTPEVCYRGAGYEMLQTPQRFTVGANSEEPGDSFWMATFARPTGQGGTRRLFWSWNAHGSWQAADNPRWQFRGEPLLYKLYVSHDGPLPAGGAAGEPTRSFLQAFLPESHAALFAHPDSK